MIKAQELRINNIINWHGREVVLEGVTKTYLTSDQEDDVLSPEDAEPIPLTSEWLERLGLILERLGKYALYHEGVPILGYWTADGAVNVGHFLTHVYYVHQLQNLYFALTGSELQLKEHAK